jgi:preprotein translocase SecE subunit
VLGADPFASSSASAEAPPPPPPTAGQNPFAAAAAESALITWPSLGSVVGSTGVVLATVAVSTLVILGVNFGLSTLSEALFD